MKNSDNLKNEGQQEFDLLRKIASRLPGVVYQYRLRPDGSSCFPYASDAIRKIYRVSPGEVREDASGAFAVGHPDDYDGVVASILKSAQDMTPWQHEYRVRYSDGTVRLLYGDAVPEREEDGSVLWTGFITDITERKQTEHELKQVATRLKLATSAGNVGVWEYDIVRNILIWDNLMFSLFGVEKKDFNSASEAWQAVVHRDDKERVDEEFNLAMRCEKDLDTEFRVCWPDGSIHYIRELAVVQSDDAGQPTRAVGTNWDITDIRMAEQKKLDDSRREMEMRFSSAFEFAAIGMALVSIEGAFLRVNKSLCSILGYTSEEMMTLSFQEISHPDDLTMDLQYVGQILAGEIDTYQMEKRYVCRQGDLVWTMLSVSLVRDHLNNPQYFISQIQDITKRKLSEMALSAALVKAEAGNRLKTAFVQNISHEVRTPLNGILGFGTMLTDPLLTAEEKQLYSQLLKASSDRLVGTITDYMDISLIESGNVEVTLNPVNLFKLLQRLKASFRELCKIKNLTFVLKIPEDLDEFTLLTDSELLRKCISQLMDNAIKFTTQGTITLGYALKPDAVEFFITDTGIGIDQNAQERVFEPFIQENLSSTRGHEGNGLGLAITKGFLDLLGGEIRVESVKGEGTAFYFSLPAVQVPIEHPDPVAPVITLQAPVHPVVLIAEDDLASDLYMEISLKSIASAVYKAPNGKIAVEMCRSHPEISIVIMDLKMPVMDGLTAMREIRTFRKELPVIAITAHAFSKDKKEAFEAGCSDFLSKPVSKMELLEKLNRYCGNITTNRD